MVGALLPNLARSSEKFWLLLLGGLGEGAGGGNRAIFCRIFLGRFLEEILNPKCLSSSNFPSIFIKIFWLKWGWWFFGFLCRFLWGWYWGFGSC